MLLLECGPHQTAADFTRWEAKATHDLWWPIRFALIDGGAGGAVALLGGRCVGGSTTVNTKVALRAHAKDLAKWHEASGLVGASGAPFGASDLAPHYDRVEARLGVRERNDWPKSVRTVEPALPRARRASSSRCARTPTRTACAAARASRAARRTPASRRSTRTSTTPGRPGRLELRADAHVERVVIEDGEATGVEYVDRRRHAQARRCGRRRRRRRGRSTRRSCSCARACRTARAAGWSAATSASTRRVSSTGCSTSRRTRTWCIRSPRTRWGTSTTRTAAS